MVSSPYAANSRFSRWKVSWANRKRSEGPAVGLVIGVKVTLVIETYKERTVKASSQTTRISEHGAALHALASEVHKATFASGILPQ